MHRNCVSLALLLCAPLLASAADGPTIQGVSWHQGGLRVEGSGFGDGPEVKLFENFEHGSYFSERLAPAGADWYAQVVAVDEGGGNTAHRAHDPAAVALGRSGVAQIMVLLGGSYRQAYLAYSVRVPDGTTFAGATQPRTFSSMSSWKFTWLMSGSNGFQEPDRFDLCTPTHVGGGNAQIGGNTGTVAWISALPNWWAWDSYNHLSTWIALEPELTSAIRYEFDVVNARGRHHVTGDNLGYPGGFINTDYLFDRVGIPGWWGNGDNSQFDGRYDNLYAAVGPNARARLMLSDAADLDASERRLHLLPSGWQIALR